MNLDYIAGLFDGEGFFTLQRNNPGRRWTVRPWRFQAIGAIVIREKYLLEQIRDTLGYGHLSVQREATDKHCQYHKIYISGGRLKRFCEDVGPKLIIKKDRAKIIHRICEIKELIGNRPVSDELYEEQEQIWGQLKQMNKKGPK